MENRNPVTWSVREVGEWLATLDLSKYRTKFEEMGIDGSLLFEITDHDLISDLEIQIRLHRVKILDSIKKLKEKPTHGPDSDSVSVDSSNQSQLDISCSKHQVHSINLAETIQPIAAKEDHCEVLVLKALEGQLMNNIFIIGAPGASIGRNTSSNDIVIGESFVSRKHCELRYSLKSNQFTISDLGSTTGTFIMIRTKQVLKLGMMIQMGLSELKVTNIRYNPYGKMVKAELSVYEGPARQSTIEVTGEGLTIGRDASNGYSVREDSQMSSFHAKIYSEKGEFYLQDVGSTNRTWLRLSGENERSEHSPVVVGDIIKIGSTVLVVQPADLSLLQIPDVRKELKKVSEDTACKICFSRDGDAALYPCGHVLCDYCAHRCSNCPVCRREIQEIVKLYR
jgi:pSer/pThr/pTyr-binding forkhead associated (FHA) protein